MSSPKSLKFRTSCLNEYHSFNAVKNSQVIVEQIKTTHTSSKKVRGWKDSLFTKCWCSEDINDAQNRHTKCPFVVSSHHRLGNSTSITVLYAVSLHQSPFIYDYWEPNSSAFYFYLFIYSQFSAVALLTWINRTASALVNLWSVFSRFWWII